jgi:GNAT superfamily N-acetyltransferase
VKGSARQARRVIALSDAPDSFGETFTDAEVRPISYWEELTRSVTEPGRDVMFLACEGNDVLGSAYGLLDRACSDAGRVGGMWVGRTWRRRGVGRALLQEVISWGRERGLRRLACGHRLTTQPRLPCTLAPAFEIPETSVGFRPIARSRSSRWRSSCEVGNCALDEWLAYRGLR